MSDPHTVVHKEDRSEFVVPETYLVESKYDLPAIVHSRPPDFDHQGLIMDVLSVGSRTRSEYVSFSIHMRDFTTCVAYR